MRLIFMVGWVFDWLISWDFWIRKLDFWSRKWRNGATIICKILKLVRQSLWPKYCSSALRKRSLPFLMLIGNPVLICRKSFGRYQLRSRLSGNNDLGIHELRGPGYEILPIFHAIASARINRINSIVSGKHTWANMKDIEWEIVGFYKQLYTSSCRFRSKLRGIPFSSLPSDVMASLEDRFFSWWDMGCCGRYEWRLSS